MGLRQSRHHHGPSELGLTLSIVIPSWNEGDRIENCINAINNASAQHETSPCIEIIVADGGSSDETVRVAQKIGAKVVTSSKGRGRQMNIGWKSSEMNSWFLFIHADSIISPQGFKRLVQAIRSEPDRGGREWGCFQSIEVKFSQSAALKEWLIRSGVECRTRLLQAPYGDQGIFIRRAAMEDLGGFKEWRLLEDVEIVSRLKKRSSPIILDSNLQTSGRRWEKLGFLKTFALNQLVLLGYRIGMDVNSLANFYYSSR